MVERHHRHHGRRPPRTSGAKGLWLHGRHAVAAALANPRRSCHRLLATPEGRARLGELTARPGLEVVEVERAELDRHLGTGVVHQGLALSVAPLADLDLMDTCRPVTGRNLVLVLDQVSDPHNLGAMLRSAAAFDVRAVVLPSRHGAPLGGVTAKAASGALDVVPVVEEVNLARALDRLAELGYWRIALDAAAGAILGTAPPMEHLALVLGAEGAGVRRRVAEQCDLTVRLPTSPAMPSLNVSVACGIALFALSRREAT
jgi:23S rRNA (guanosine2251-2'-O)-methyltransferase